MASSPSSTRKRKHQRRRRKKNPNTSLNSLAIIPSKKKRLLISIDWLSLPSDLLTLIAANLTKDLSDLRRFRQVCRQWRSAVTKLPQPLFLGSDGDCGTIFFSVATKKEYRFQIPGATPNSMPYVIYTSSCGWLLIHNVNFPRDRRIPRLALFNPFSHVLIPLPPLRLSRDIIDHCKIISHPDHQDESSADTTATLVVMVARSPNIYSCRLRFNRDHNAGAWTKSCYKFTSTVGKGGEPKDFTHHQGRYVILDGDKCNTSIIDPQTKRVVSEIPWVSVEGERAPDFDISSRFLVQSSSGNELYLLVSHSFPQHLWFHVFRLDQAQGEWTRVTDIGQDVILVDSSQAMALPASDVNGGIHSRGNCIVFLTFPVQESERVPVVFNVYDIGNDTVEKFPRSFQGDPSTDMNAGWFVTKL